MRALLLCTLAACTHVRTLNKPVTVSKHTLDSTTNREAFEDADPLPFPLGEVIGFADLHTHPFAEDGYGQRVVLGGAPGGGSHWHGMRPGLSKTLKAVAPSMVNDPTAAALLRHNTEGSEPAFHDWTHDQYTRRQMEQAHHEGLRFMGALAVNQQLSCAIAQSYTGANRWTCSDLTNIRRQVDATWSFDEDNEWFHVALSPVAANHAMAAGRTAVMLGYEASDYLDHRRRGGLIPRRNLWGDGWRDLVVEARVDGHTTQKQAETYLKRIRKAARKEAKARRKVDGSKGDQPARVTWQAEVLTEVLRNQGMRTFIPIHHWNNALGGNALQQITLLQPGYEMVANQGRLQKLSALRLGAGFGQFILRQDDLSTWPTVVELGEDTHMDGVRYMRNAQGLTPLGRQVYHQAYEKGFLIDLAHLGDNSVHDALDEDVLPANAPVMLSHYTPRATTLRHRDEREYQASQSLLMAVAARGGVVGLRTAGERVRGMGGPVPNICHGSLFSFAQMYEYSINLGLNPAYGTDMNGGASQTWPAAGADFGCGAQASEAERQIGRALAAQWALEQKVSPGSVWVLGMEHAGLIGDMTGSLDAIGQPMLGVWTTGSASTDAWYRSVEKAPAPPPLSAPMKRVAGRHDRDGDCIPDVMENLESKGARPNPLLLRKLLTKTTCAPGDDSCISKLPVCPTGPAQELTSESTKSEARDGREQKR